MEIILLQMGKVASTAIARALRDAGGEVLQAHIGAPERLIVKYRTLMSDQVSDGVAARLFADYLQELRVTFLLARRRLNGKQAADPIRVITLARDPLAWYWSHIAQNYDHYQDQLMQFHRAGGGTDSDLDPEATFARIQQLMFGVLAETKARLDSVVELPQIVSQAQEVDASGVVASHAYSFLRPLRWFDEDFLPATGIDVYEAGFDSARGWGLAEATGVSALILRYEDLDDQLGAIADFTGLGPLTLPAANRSVSKHLPFDIEEMRARGLKAMPGELVERVHATRYARHFGYPRQTPAERRGTGTAAARWLGPAFGRLWRLLGR